jgi:hypothetical protein
MSKVTSLISNYSLCASKLTTVILMVIREKVQWMAEQLIDKRNLDPPKAP